MRIAVFDIDGTLTTDEGMEQYKKEKRKAPTTVVGIVSARSQASIDEFVEENDLKPDFARSAKLKGIQLWQLKHEWTPDEMIYYGSWVRDRAHSLLAGVDYQEF